MVGGFGFWGLFGLIRPSRLCTREVSKCWNSIYRPKTPIVQAGAGAGAGAVGEGVGGVSLCAQARAESS